MKELGRAVDRVEAKGLVQVLAGAFSRGVLGIQPASLLPYMVALVGGLILWPLSRHGHRAGLPPRGRVALLLAAWLALT